MLGADNGNGNADNGKALAPPSDDLVLPFRTVKSDVIGRVVRLGPLVNAILSRHAYPEPVSHALGEALALTAMLGSALKSGAKLILQTKTDGPLDFLVVHFEQPGPMLGNARGYASFDKSDAGLAATRGRGDQGALLGTGHLAMTIDPGGGRDRYQGIVAVAREPLLKAAHEYFRQSEQLPTFIRLAVARHYGPAEGGAGGGPRAWHWRAGGLMIQQLPREGGTRSRLEGEAHDLSLEGEDDENWNRARHLAATVEDHELIDPMLAPERLLYRLFHEEGVRVVPATGLAEVCRCSRERIEMYLQRFGPEELAELREPDGSLTVTCEFCSRKYRFP
jgi:molecular chaperone Hsp33